MKTIRVYISGTVQGVLYRKHLEEQGNKIGVRGFLRQNQDGRIEAVFEGTENKVNQMLEVCKQGTKHATVRNVEVHEIKYQGFEGFRISKL